MKTNFPWSPSAFKRRIKRHGLSSYQTADLFGVQPRTAQYWLSHQGPPYAVALVFALMEHYGLTPADLEEIGNQLTKK